MLPRRSRLKKRIRLQFRGIRLLSPQKRNNPPKIDEEDDSLLSEFDQSFSHRVDLLTD